MGKKIVMGTNTYNSLPKKLEGREYIILSRSLKNVPDCLIFDNFNDLLKYIKSLSEEVMIIGGASIYKLFLPYADKLFLTEIDDTKEADAYFPKFDKTKYKCQILKENNENLKYKFVVYERKYENE
jgi:dihydrofolate reductase